jgi:hypothetical protein
MQITVSLGEDGKNELGPAASKEFHSALDRYADNLLREAERLEAAQRSTAGPPELTGSNVKDADWALRRGLANRQKPWSVRVCQLFSAVGGLTVGLLYDKDSLREPGALVLFVCVLALTLGTTLFVWLKE